MKKFHDDIYSGAQKNRGQHFRATPRAWQALLLVCMYIQYISLFSYMYVTTRVTYNSLKSQRFKFLHTHFPPIFLQSQHQISAALLFHSEYLCTIQNTSIDVIPIRRHPPRSAMQCFWVFYLFYLFFVLGGGYMSCIKYMHVCTLHKLPLLSLSCCRLTSM